MQEVSVFQALGLHHQANRGPRKKCLAIDADRVFLRRLLAKSAPPRQFIAISSKGEVMMRFLTLATALAFSVGAVSMAQACPGMKSADYGQQQIVATDKAPSTPIVIPEKPKS